jgi:hypothetical protein
MPTATAARKPAAKRRTCVECGKRIPTKGLRWHRRLITCSAKCSHARQGWSRATPSQPKRKPQPSQSPPILGILLTEAAERLGISRQAAHQICVQHGLGRLCNDGRWWLTLGELRALTVALPD